MKCRHMMPIALSLGLAGCGQARNFMLTLQGSGTSGKVRPAPPGDGDEETMVDLRGSIASRSGSSAAMTGWRIAAIERDTGIARVAEIDRTGNYLLRRVATSRPQTLALLTPDFILQGVLATPGGPMPNVVRPYVLFERDVVPELVSQGPIIALHDYDGITITRDLAADSDGDGVPDGVDRPTENKMQLLAPRSEAPKPTPDVVVDSDLDGVPNVRDPDIDGDGVANGFDPDDDGDAIIDAVDGDQNGDLVSDYSPEGWTTDRHFREGLEYLSVQVEQRPAADASGTVTAITLGAKVRPNIAPRAVTVRGAPSLLHDAVIVVQDPTGNPVTIPWNRQLLDYGTSHDGSAGDGLFAERVIVGPGKAPRAHEALFVRLELGPEDDPWAMEYPLTFPDVSLQPITASADPATRVVTLAGNPLGAVDSFSWMIVVYDSLGDTVWISEAIPGVTRHAEIPAAVWGHGHRFEAVTVSLLKTGGRPAYSIHSPTYDLP